MAAALGAVHDCDLTVGHASLRGGGRSNPRKSPAMMIRTPLRAIGLGLFAAVVATGAAAETISAPVVTPHVRAQLVALDRVDGGRVSLGLRLTVKPGWHTY